MLQNPKFNFSNKPKAVLPFHFKNGKQVTPIEEHINESVFYAKPNEKTSIHFTISKEHQFLFEEIASQTQMRRINFADAVYKGHELRHFPG